MGALHASVSRARHDVVGRRYGLEDLVAIGSQVAVPAKVTIAESGLLVLAGLELPAASTASIASRLWFLAGEVLTFALGWAASRRGTG